MIAVAVAMSVIIFMWSQGFLSNTSNAVGGQQGSQNQAAQSAIAVEQVTFTGTTTMTIVIRNVGATGVFLGSITVSPSSGNTGFTSPMTDSITLAANPVALGKGCGVVVVMIIGVSATPTYTCTTLATWTFGTPTGSGTFASGDSVTVKATSTVGTFGSASGTVP